MAQVKKKVSKRASVMVRYSLLLVMMLVVAGILLVLGAVSVKLIKTR